MPYINSNNGRREALQKGEPAQSAGELNYQIFYYVKHQAKSSYLTERFYYIIKSFVDGFLGEHPNYQRYNDMTGCLIRCYKEIHRRLLLKMQILIDIMDSYDSEINIYEDIKINENGDVE